MAYREVFQTWNFIVTEKRPSLVVSSDAPVDNSTEEWRHAVQRARIARRWSIAELARRIEHDAETLAAFERGTQVLDDTTHRRLRKQLGLLEVQLPR